MTDIHPIIREAERLAQQRRWAFRHLLRINEAGASSEDIALVEKVRAVNSADAYDKALADKKVNALFCRGVLSFGVAR